MFFVRGGRDEQPAEASAPDAGEAELAMDDEAFARHLQEQEEREFQTRLYAMAGVNPGSSSQRHKAAWRLCSRRRVQTAPSWTPCCTARCSARAAQRLLARSQALAQSRRFRLVGGARRAVAG